MSANVIKKIYLSVVISSKIMLTLLILLLICSLSYEIRRMAVTKETTKMLKQIAPWSVMEYEDNIFKSWTMQDVRHILSMRRSSKGSKKVSSASSSLPSSYDPRLKDDCINPIMEQGVCGGSWAIAVAKSLGDRFCKQRRSEAANLAPQILLSCDTHNYACHGGYLMHGWEYAQLHGLTPELCVPYSSFYGEVETCPEACKRGGSFTVFRCKEKSIRELSYDIDAMKKEIVEQGSVSLSIIVYLDFLYYAGGIYQHVYGENVGRQAVRAVGFGTENGTPYWICANSWGGLWGERGWFKIAFHEADAEDDVWTCTAELKNS